MKAALFPRLTMSPNCMECNALAELLSEALSPFLSVASIVLLEQHIGQIQCGQRAFDVM